MPGQAMLAQNILQSLLCAAISRLAASSHQKLAICKRKKLSRPGKPRWRVTQWASISTPMHTKTVNTTGMLNAQPELLQRFMTLHLQPNGPSPEKGGITCGKPQGKCCAGIARKAR